MNRSPTREKRIRTGEEVMDEKEITNKRERRALGDKFTSCPLCGGIKEYGYVKCFHCSNCDYVQCCDYDGFYDDAARLVAREKK